MMKLEMKNKLYREFKEKLPYKLSKCIIEEKKDYMDGKGIHFIFKFHNHWGCSVAWCPGSKGYEKGLWDIVEVVFHKNEYALNHRRTSCTTDLVIALIEMIEDRHEFPYGEWMTNEDMLDRSLTSNVLNDRM